MVYRRKNRNLKKSIAWKKPTAKNQKNQLYSLAKQVSTLQKVQKTLREYGRYGIEESGNIATGAFSSGVTTYNLTKPDLWSNIFDNPADLNAKFKCKILSYKIDNFFSSGTHTKPIDYTYFVVSLKSNTANSVLYDTNNNLANVVDGRHFSKVGGLIMLNRKYFNIHKVRKFTLTATEYTDAASGGSNPQTTFKRFSMKVKLPRMLTGDQYSWKGLTENDIKPASRLYILCFHDGITDYGSNANLWRMNALTTVVA